MVRVLAALLQEVLVGLHAARFESLRGDLFLLTRDEMDAKRELIDISTLGADIIDTDTSVWKRKISLKNLIRS